MDFGDVKDVNHLFGRLYPYIARQILDAYGRDEGLALEIGPYGPGISIAISNLCPKMKITVGDDYPGIIDYFRQELEAASLAHRIEIKELDKFNLPYAEGSFDLVYFRGALFFWEKEAQILKEMYRVLKPGGVALAGGGFGASTPDEVISEILDRSHELNRRLSKRVLSDSELTSILAEAGLTDSAQWDKRHGLWVVLRRS